MRILLAEDDRDVADYVRRGLEEEDNSVSVEFDGASALRTAQAESFDVIVLDIMLPQMDGLEVTRKLRASQNATPIVLLTARDSPRDIVKGLDAGADDYLTKPFSFDVLLARLRARTRGTIGTTTKLSFRDLMIDLDRHEARRGKLFLRLTPTEFSILECLLRSSGRVVTRQRLIDTVWGPDRDVGNNNLDVFMRLLRSKVDLPGIPPLIQTLRGIGYSLRDSTTSEK
jgi:DNA-binding response OmpR family regulator